MRRAGGVMRRVRRAKDMRGVEARSLKMELLTRQPDPVCAGAAEYPGS